MYTSLANFCPSLKPLELFMRLYLEKSEYGKDVLAIYIDSAIKLTVASYLKLVIFAEYNLISFVFITILHLKESSLGLESI